MKVEEIKRELRLRGLQTNGSKEELINRLDDFKLAPVHTMNLQQDEYRLNMNDLVKPFHKSIYHMYDKQKSQSKEKHLIELGELISNINDTNKLGDHYRVGNFIYNYCMSKSQSGKCKAGKNLEDFLVYIFKTYTNFKVEQRTRILGKEADISLYKNDKIIAVVSCKTKLRERGSQDYELREICKREKIKFYALTLDCSNNFYVKIEENIIENIIDELLKMN